MTAATSIRPEMPEDAAAIFDLTQTAFAPMLYSDGTEGPIVEGLRRDGDLLLSLVMEQDKQIIGHIAFSPVTFADSPEATGWCALGPVSIAPDHQGKGLGRTLIETGLDQMRAKTCPGIVLIGDPDLYGRFGFSADCGLTYQGLDGKYVQALNLVEATAMPRGEIHFAAAFNLA